MREADLTSVFFGK